MMVARTMKPGDVYVVINDIGPPPAGLGHDPAWDLDPSLPSPSAEMVLEGPGKAAFCREHR